MLLKFASYFIQYLHLETLDEPILFFLSVMICPVLEKILS